MSLPEPKWWLAAIAFWWLPGGALWAATGTWELFLVGWFVWAVVLKGLEES